MNQTQKEKAVTTATKWICEQLYQEQATGEQKTQLGLWLTAFQKLYQHGYDSCTPVELVEKVRKEAKRYYFRMLAVETDTAEDMAWYCFILSRGLLKALGYFPGKPANRPRPKADHLPDLLTVEALHRGHFTCLLDAFERNLTHPAGFDYYKISLN